MDSRQILRLLVVLLGLTGACDGEYGVFVCFGIVLFTGVRQFGSFNCVLVAERLAFNTTTTWRWDLTTGPLTLLFHSFSLSLSVT